MDVEDERLMAAFGRRLRQLRMVQGYSQEALAHEAGVDRTYVSGIERGIRNPSLRNIGRLARALGVPIRRMFE